MVVLAVAAAAVAVVGCPMGQEKATRSYPHLSLLRLFVHLNQGASLSSKDSVHKVRCLKPVLYESLRPIKTCTAWAKNTQKISEL